MSANDTLYVHVTFQDGYAVDEHVLSDLRRSYVDEVGIGDDGTSNDFGSQGAFGEPFYVIDSQPQLATFWVTDVRVMLDDLDDWACAVTTRAEVVDIIVTIDDGEEGDTLERRYARGSRQADRSTYLVPSNHHDVRRAFEDSGAARAAIEELLDFDAVADELVGPLRDVLRTYDWALGLVSRIG